MSKDQREETIADRKLRDHVDGYEPPSEEEIEEWLAEAPSPREAVEYPPEVTGDVEADGGDPYDPTDEFADDE